MTWTRVGIVVALLVVFTAAFHAVSHGENVPIHRGLASFPKQIGGWQGEDVEVDPDVERVLKADDILLRLYRGADVGTLGLYVAYFQSQRELQTIHSPKNCLPGSGWEPVEARRGALDLGDGQKIFVNRYVIQNGVERQLVYYWYQSHGRTIASEYRAKAYMALDAIRLNRTDGAIVRISVPIVGDAAETESVAQDFVRRSYPILRQFIPE